MERKGDIVKQSALASGSHSIICPSCEAGELRSGGHNGVQCPVCGYAPSRGLLEALRQIITLPDALGRHACEECGHPEMRRLPEGVSHCPACGSEVLPTRSNSRTQAVGKSRGHRQGAGGGNPRRGASTEEVQLQARDASAGEEVSPRKVRKILSASHRGLRRCRKPTS
jgi:ribosomal protein L37AE/L43A